MSSQLTFVCLMHVPTKQQHQMGSHQMGAHSEKMSSANSLTGYEQRQHIKNLHQLYPIDDFCRLLHFSWYFLINSMRDTHTHLICAAEVTPLADTSMMWSVQFANKNRRNINANTLFAHNIRCNASLFVCIHFIATILLLLQLPLFTVFSRFATATRAAQSARDSFAF